MGSTAAGHYTNELEDLELFSDSTKTSIVYAEILSEEENTQKKVNIKQRYFTKAMDSFSHFGCFGYDSEV